MLPLLFILALSISTKEIDVSTFSNYLEVETQHLTLEWLLDIEISRIDAIIELNFKFVVDGIQKISLDIYKLQISSVYLPSKVQLEFFIDYPYKEADFGQRLNIKLAKVYNKGETVTIRINYVIDDQSKAISFMTKEQTSTGTHPYLFSQCEDANCRSLAPLQDTPAIKSTYSAIILWEKKWTKDINAYMSADLVADTKALMGNYGTKVLTRRSFEQTKRIPSYLIAIVAGNIAKKPTSSGGRTFVISEDNNMLNQYVFELQDMEAFLLNLEAYIGPYTWGTYTLVIQPPSFPIGGMENPLLTFANPTIMVGDGSGLAVAIHEMAHSWFGNTITCVNWSNMWINEGFTVFLERKASYSYYSTQLTPQKSLDMIKIAATGGNSSMVDSMYDYGFQSTFSSLHPDVTGVNPDNSFSEIPYEKGYQLLAYLESIVGADAFQKLLRNYINYYQWQSVDENDFYQFLLAFLSDQPDSINKINKVKAVYLTWVYQPGLPPITIDLSTAAITDAKTLAQAYITAQGKSVQDGDKTFNNYLPNQKHIFLQYLIDNVSKVTSGILTAIDTQLKLSTDKDSEIKFRWFRANLLAKDQSRNSYIIPFLQTTGRGKMILPVYKALKEINLPLAQKTFTEAIKFYHPIQRNNLQAMLFPTSIIE